MVKGRREPQRVCVRVCVCVSGLGSGAWCVCVCLLIIGLVAQPMTSWHTTAEQRKECLLSSLQTEREKRWGDRTCDEGWR